MVSDTETCEAQYWVQNMVSTVQFSNAVSAACMSLHTGNETTSLDLSHKSRLDTHGFLEIGPHAALRTPVEEIIGTVLSTREIMYSSTLIRNTPGTITFLQALGSLYCAGYRLDLRRVASLLTRDDRPASLLPSMPAYPFEHSTQHLEDSRVNAEFRFTKFPPHKLLGAIIDSNPLESKWRLIIRETELPWISDHKVNGIITYPAAGMLAMVIEATKQHLDGRLPLALEFENVDFIAPVLIAPDFAEGGVELHLTLNSTHSAEGRTDSEF